MVDLLIKNIGVLATPTGKAAKRGAEQNEITILQNAYLAVDGDKIHSVGTGTPTMEARSVIDAQSRLVTPGLVDSHTHLVFGGWRQHEMELKLKGAGYLDILKAGGGILSTVRATREAGEDELYAKSKKLLLEMEKHGTTTVEAKSGYGLNLETELKQLRVIKKLAGDFNIAATFMGAHALPEEFKDDRDSYIRLVTEEMLPAVARENLAEFCDIFCETAVFDVNESRKILEAAKKYGLKIKIHADEIDPIGGAELAGDLQAASAEHLIQASDEGIKKMAQSGTIAVLLPATSFYLDKAFARARKMLEENMAVAIASDFNPGSSPGLSMQLPMNLACMRYKLTPAEALTAATLNAAAAISREDTVGTLEEGKQADIAIWDCPDLNFLFYRFGNNQIKYVIRKGELVYEN